MADVREDIIVNDDGYIVTIDPRKSVDEIAMEAVEEYIADNAGLITVDNIRGEMVKIIKGNILGRISYKINNENKKNHRNLKNQDLLRPNQVARILHATGDFKCILSADKENRRLVMRQRDGEYEGTYRFQGKGNSSELDRLTLRLNANADTKFNNEVINNLLTICDCVKQTNDGIHIPCKNGIIDIKTMEFTGWKDADFDKKYGDCVYLTKLEANWNPNATNVVLHNDDDGTDWDVEYQIDSCLDKQESRQLIWEMYNFLFRGVSGGKTVWLLNAKGQAGGGGGKTTVTTLAENVIGKDNVLRKPVEEWSGQYALYKLPEKVAIMAHESDSNTKSIEKSSIYKNISRGQAVTCAGKYKQEFEYEFKGQVSLEINGFPKFLDRSSAVHRNDLIIPFEKNFDNGTPRDYIVKQYVYNKDVLEYVLYKALSIGPIAHFAAECVEAEKDSLREVKAANSDVFAMMEQIEGTFAMNTVPVSLLFDIYKAWMTEENGAKYTLTLRNFKSDLAVWCKDSEKWEFVKGPVRLKRGAEKEYVVAEYGYAMRGWQAHQYSGSVDVKTGGQISDEKLNKVYMDGIRRTEEGERIKAREQATKQDADTAKYEAFRGKWFEVYVNDLIAGKITPDAVPTMERWIGYGRPYYNNDTKRFESDSYESTFTGILTN